MLDSSISRAQSTKWTRVLVLLIALGVACLAGGLWITQQHNEALAVVQQQHELAKAAAEEAALAAAKATAAKIQKEYEAVLEAVAKTAAEDASKHELELTTALQQHRAELEAARQPAAAPPRSVRWAISCGGPTPECVGQVNHGCGPRHNGVLCAQGLFCDDQLCLEYCKDTPMREGHAMERVEGMCDYLPCEISWLFDEGSPEPVGQCLESKATQQQHNAELEAELAGAETAGAEKDEALAAAEAVVTELHATLAALETASAEKDTALAAAEAASAEKDAAAEAVITELQIALAAASPVMQQSNSIA